jgi:GTP-binding protein
MHGRNAQNVTITVPLGTTLSWKLEKADFINHEDHFKFQQGYEPLADRMLLLKQKLRTMFPEQYRRKNTATWEGSVDLMTEGQRVELLKGGMGGMGNPFFSSREWPYPRVCSRGSAGQSGSFTLELKTIADIALVGMPNAGKSSLLAAISNAHPKIAAYPFTTLNPYVGTIDYDNDQVTVADIPGLIPGAHANIGLGHDFLRHVERCQVLIYVVDLSRSQPWLDLEMLHKELEAYRPGLSTRKSMVVCNKADLAISKTNWQEMQRRVHRKLVPCSAMLSKNIKMVTFEMRELLNK